MKKIFKVLSLVFMLAVLFSTSFSTVSADEITEQMGFVEYQTDASINFDQVIEVILINKDTGDYTTHRLYRANDYLANFSVPFGTYSVQASVIKSSNTANSYLVYGMPKEIVVQNAHSAILIPLCIEEFIGTDVSGEDGADLDDDYYEDDFDEGYDYELEDQFSDDEEEDSETSVSSPVEGTADGEEDNKKGKDMFASGPSMLVSLFASVLFLIVITAILFFIKKKKSE